MNDRTISDPPMTLMTMSEDQRRLFMIFFPHAAASYMRLLGRPSAPRFVQYTRAEAALQIIRTQRVWMRKAQWMNDYREVDHGWESLLSTYRESEPGKHFKDVMESIHPGINKAFTDNFDPWVNEYRLNTFVTSISEHEDDEDINGRLSMWRAYGSGTGVAFVVKSAPFMMVSDGLGAYSSPVAYFSQSQMESHFESIATAVEGNREFLAKVPQPQILALLHEAFRYGMICCKHPGFAEEREWRIVYNPQRDQKKVLLKSVEIVGGIPQPIYSIPLTNIVDYTDLSLNAILDRVIIGPTRFPSALLESFRIELENAGVSDVRSKVVFSDIPLRT